MNVIFPQIISLALGRPTKGIELNWDDMQELVKAQIATRWVGSRNVRYDGFPTIGKVAENAGCVSNASSGGVSFSHALVKTFFGQVKPEYKKIAEEALIYGDPNTSLMDGLKG